MIINSKPLKIFLLLTTSTNLLTFLVSNNYLITKNQTILLNKVNDISTVSQKDFDNAYKGQIFYQDLTKQKFQEKNSNIDYIEDITLAKSFYKQGSYLQKSTICGTQYTSKKQLDYLLDKEKNNIIKKSFLHANVINVDNWNLYESDRTIKSLDWKWKYPENTSHMGDLCEFTDSYYIEDNDYYYSLITHETYIIPNYSDGSIHGPGYWPYQLIYNSNNKSLNDTIIECCEPTTKGTTTEITYSNNFKVEVGTSGISITAGVYSSYTTTISSPEILDQSDLFCGFGKIIFSYVDINKKIETYKPLNFKNYITNQSFQTSIQIYKTKKNNSLKNKFLALNDSNEISIFGPWVTYNTYHDWTGEVVDIPVYHYYPEHKNEAIYHFEFKTPKYILVNQED